MSANKPYQDPAWMRYYYVQRRMSLKDIVKLLDEKYACKVTIQTLYNYAKKYDLLRLKGKGRNMGQRSMKKPPKSSMQLRIEKKRRDQLKAQKMRSAVHRKKS